LKTQVEGWKVSGRSKSEFCNREGLRLSSFCNWEKILRQRDFERRVEERKSRRKARGRGRQENGIGSRSLFVPLDVGKLQGSEARAHWSEIGRSAQIEIVIPDNGLVVRIGSDFNAGMLHEVLDALRGWTC